LTIKSTSHTRRRYFFRAYLKLVFSMPVNIQLSKIEESFQLSALSSQLNKPFAPEAAKSR
jgi:hypothetical protein